MPALADNRRRPRILTERQHTLAGHIGIAEHGQRHHAIIFRCFRIIEDSCDLLQMRRTQKEVDVVKSLRTEQCQSGWIDTQNILPLKTSDLDVLLRQQAIRCLISSGLKQRLPRKIGGRHWSALFCESLEISACKAGHHNLRQFLSDFSSFDFFASEDSGGRERILAFRMRPVVA